MCIKGGLNSWYWLVSIPSHHSKKFILIYLSNGKQLDNLKRFRNLKRNLYYLISNLKTSLSEFINIGIHTEVS